MTKVYEEICVGCWRERLCHQDMQLCEAYEAAIAAVEPTAQGGEFAKDMNVLGKHRGQIIEEE